MHGHVPSGAARDHCLALRGVFHGLDQQGHPVQVEDGIVAAKVHRVVGRGAHCDEGGYRDW